MQVSTFIARIKRCNKRIVVNKLPGRVWGIALKQPRHPDANEHGYVSLFSMTSPSWYGSSSIPDKTLVNADGQIMARGWKVMVQLLVGKGQMKRSQANSLFHSWENA